MIIYPVFRRTDPVHNVERMLSFRSASGESRTLRKCHKAGGALHSGALSAARGDPDKL
jgi:hypothetical protein